MNAAAGARPKSALERGFQIGDLRVDPAGGDLSGPGGREQLDPKVMGVLVVLAEHAGRVVSRDELHARLWRDIFVTDDALSRCLYELRRQLSAAGGSEEFRALVETLPKRGYRLNAEVTPLEPAAGKPATAPGRRNWVPAVVAIAVAAIALALIAAWPPKARTDPSIAVLPFADFSEAQDQAYLADGIAEEILDTLHRLTDLKVIARTSSFAFRGGDAAVAEIAQKLKVTHVLEGSVRRSGDRVRVTAQLIAASDSTHIWSDTYERKLGDLFAIQDEIAGAVAAELQTRLALGEPASRRAPKFEAFDLVKRGEKLYYRRAPGDLERATELFEDAVRQDPGYARAWAVLAGAYSKQAWSADPPSSVLRARQGEAALKAVELDPNLALAHARLAQYYSESGDEDGSRKHMEIASRLDPDDPIVLGYMATIAVEAGDLDLAIERQKRAAMRDPMSMTQRQNLGVLLLADGRLDAALDSYQTLLTINPDIGPDVEVEVSRILAMQGRHPEARAAAEQLPPGRFRDHALALLHRSSADRAESEAALKRLEAYVPAADEDNPELLIMNSVRLAEVYAWRGMNQESLTTLENRLQSLSDHPERGTYVWYLRYECRVAPLLKPLHDDPRWVAFMADAA